MLFVKNVNLLQEAKDLPHQADDDSCQYGALSPGLGPLQRTQTLYCHDSSREVHRNRSKMKMTNLSEMCPLDKMSSVTAEMNSRYISSSSLSINRYSLFWMVLKIHVSILA